MRPSPAALVVLAGVAAALHVGKLPPALPALQLELGLSLLQAAFLLSAVQLAGMALGLAGGALADAWGARRSLLAGLTTLALASAIGGFVTDATGLLVLRGIEGLGFMLAVLPAPGLVRQLAQPGSESTWLGLWGAYMPLATALALLLGPGCVAAFGWPAWWWSLAAVAALAAVAVGWGVPAPARVASSEPAARGALQRFANRVRRTLAAPAPWAVALAFGCYSAQWLAVIGFLPTLAAGQTLALAPAWIAPLTALVAAANIVGNLAAGRLLQAGWRAGRLLALGFAAMALAALATFATVDTTPWLPTPLRYAAVLLFSAFGGLIPATLFASALRLAPDPGHQASTIGWMQQGSSAGQFAGPPLVAAVATAAGGWHWSGAVTAAFCAAGLVISVWIAALLRQRGG